MKRFIAGFICFVLMFTINSRVLADATAQTESAVVYDIVYSGSGLKVEKNYTAHSMVEVRTEGAVTEYNVLAVSDTGNETWVKVELRELLYNALEYADEQAEIALTIKTDIATVQMTRSTMEELFNVGRYNKVYFEIKKSEKIENEALKRLMEDARYEINYGFGSASGKINELEGNLDVCVPFVSNTTQNVHIYEVQDTMVVDMNAEYKDNLLIYSGSPVAHVLVSEENLLEITGRTLDLQGTISLVFYATIEGLEQDRVKMLFWESKQGRYTLDTADRVVGCSGIDKNGYRFEYRNVTSKDMSKPIYARLVAEKDDGTLKYSSAPRQPYSAVQYAENMMKNQKLKPLLIKMLNYGTAAQEYFGSDNEPANSVLKEGERSTDFTKTYSSTAATIAEDSGKKTSAYIAGKTISLEGDISVNYYVLDNESTEESGMLFWSEYDFATTKNHVLGTESRRVTEYDTNGAYKVYSYKNIVSRQMYNSIYARAYTKVNGEYRYSDIDKYSVKDYTANQLEKNDNPKLVKLLRCLMLYGEEARRYFDSL
ncbi:MAG: hypothetical protein IKW64_02940 [Clostridia bacterium]|nr:hypothetical protein [Clostridia bacterium]